MATRKLTLEERFWSKVLKTETCWLWQRRVNNKGYGCFCYPTNYSTTRGTQDMYAHRVSWILTNGPIPQGQNVLHKCDTPACVNPDHLFLGTQRDNMIDCRNKGRLTQHGARNSRLTADDIRAIRRDPRRHHVIAADYGLKRLAIYDIKHRRSWWHID